MKTKRNWGLFGLLGLGGLLMMGASGSSDDESGGGDEPGNDEPGHDGPGGSEPDDDTTPTMTFTWGGPTTPDPPPSTDAPRPRPKPPTTTDGPKPPTTTGGNETPPRVPPPSDDGPPWSELVDPYPRGETFYPVVEGDRFGGTSSKHSIAYRFLLSEAFLAARDLGGLGEDEAITWAVAVAKQDKIRLACIELIQCSGWNDAMYGANPVSQSHASAHGRSILLRPVHGPTGGLLALGKTPFRNVTLGGNPADDDERHYEMLWMPGIDRALLWDSGGIVVSTMSMVWADGTSKANPPPWVMALGMEDTSGALEGDFGCPGSDGELETT